MHSFLDHASSIYYYGEILPPPSKATFGPSRQVWLECYITNPQRTKCLFGQIILSLSYQFVQPNWQKFTISSYLSLEDPTITFSRNSSRQFLINGIQISLKCLDTLEGQLLLINKHSTPTNFEILQKWEWFGNWCCKHQCRAFGINSS